MQNGVEVNFIRFFELVSKLKEVNRQGWVDRLGIKNPESVADHSFSMAVMAMVLSNMTKIDANKVMKMTLLHDLAESEVGDITPGSVSKKNKKELEEKSMARILQYLPSEIATECRNLWTEYIDKQTKEAIFVSEIDKLEMILQARIYAKEGFAKSKMEPFIRTAQKEIRSTELRSLLAKLLQGF